jgi:exopolyphosphatase/guanosine-5'-triphosphate,3'-diphosphate pyrophosphatase
MRKADNPEIFGAIHLGSEQAGIQIVQYKTLTDVNVVDKAFREVTLGEEIFKTGKISFGTLNDICDLLKGYRRMLCEYGVRDYRLFATTAVREARNQRYIVDQIRVKTGFCVEVVDMPQEIFYKYYALFKTLQEQNLVGRKDAILFVDISSGGLGFTLYKDGCIHYQQNIHIGALRIKESFDKNQRESVQFPQALAEYIFSTIAPVKEELGRHKIKYLVLAGNETKLVLKILGRTGNDKLTFIEPQEFTACAEELRFFNIPHLMTAYDFNEHRAEIVLPTLILYQQILSLTEAGQIVVPNTTFIDGVTLHHVAEKTQDSFVDVVEEQIISLAHTLGKKYAFDVDHAVIVSDVALNIFDSMTKAHGLGKRERFLLKIAGILHDIGKFVSLRRHYFYSYRLIVSSDIFGFSDEEKHIMANVAYYHSKGTPSDADNNFQVLPEQHKTIVSKLVAMMRLADAIDRSHRQKITECTVNLKGDELIISYISLEDTSLEEWTFDDKADFFEEVFGIRALLKRQGR